MTRHTVLVKAKKKANEEVPEDWDAQDSDSDCASGSGSGSDGGAQAGARLNVRHEHTRYADGASASVDAGAVAGKLPAGPGSGGETGRVQPLKVDVGAEPRAEAAGQHTQSAQAPTSAPSPARSEQKIRILAGGGGSALAGLTSTSTKLRGNTGSVAAPAAPARYADAWDDEQAYQVDAHLNAPGGSSAPAQARGPGDINGGAAEWASKEWNAANSRLPTLAPTLSSRGTLPSLLGPSLNTSDVSRQPPKILSRPKDQYGNVLGLRQDEGGSGAAKKKTLKEREEEYREARDRIFGAAAGGTQEHTKETRGSASASTSASAASASAAVSSTEVKRNMDKKRAPRPARNLEGQTQSRSHSVPSDVQEAAALGSQKNRILHAGQAQPRAPLPSSASASSGSIGFKNHNRQPARNRAGAEQ
ncbi:CAMP-REGULATED PHOSPHOPROTEIN 21 RELATED R3H DOMAIN CONTAINING PROTEIN [Ceraceosorus bombacis]|uniref:cAMP-REGULATED PHOSPHOPROTEIN 21 RELATED R3H DOMAIN CONTAINING PROTEIN n=1 Tax=Ceraceosorus bombacis TaxID=401625 RepID=A0A0P1BNW6_9BASI|nr:CAMP-REGULATED PHOSPHOPROTEIN 21 RELATED R3H DOMAIN CONTAINING PROTEIN [Ceraceosorus bombacis]